MLLTLVIEAHIRQSLPTALLLRHHSVIMTAPRAHSEWGGDATSNSTKHHAQSPTSQHGTQPRDTSKLLEEKIKVGINASRWAGNHKEEQSRLPKLTASTLATVPYTKGMNTHNRGSTSTWSLSELSQDGQSHIAPSNPTLGQAYQDLDSPRAAHDQTAVKVWGEPTVADFDTDLEVWLKNVTTPPTEHLKQMIEEDELSLRHCDIDAATGQVLDQIPYPQTMRGPEINLLDKKIRFKQEYVTSTLVMEREMRNRQMMANAFKAKQAQQQADAKQEVRDPKHPSQPSWPTANCGIRPATPADFEALAQIINSDMEEEYPSIFETVAITASHVHKLYEECKVSRRPFIVATELPKSAKTFMDPAKWPSMEAYQEFCTEYEEFLKTQQAEMPVSAKVLGFAVATEATIGFLSTASAATRYACRLQVVVHPQYRRQKVGTALLDKILSVVYPYHRSLIDYEWKCDEPEGTYETPTRNNVRQYNKIYMETYVEHKGLQDVSWKAEMLGKYGFANLVTIKQAAKLPGNTLAKWLDMTLWQLEGHDVKMLPDAVPGSLFAAPMVEGASVNEEKD